MFPRYEFHATSCNNSKEIRQKSFTTRWLLFKPTWLHVNVHIRKLCVNIEFRQGVDKIKV